MSTFKLKKEMLADFPELAEQMREMNINRVSYVGLTFFFFLMLNLVNNPMSQGRSIVIGTAMVTFLSLTYSISAFVFRKSILSSAVIAKTFYLSFWVLMMLGMTPFLVHDITSTVSPNATTPMNLTLFFTALIVVPCFSERELYIIYPTFFLYNLLIAFVNSAPVAYIVFIFGISIAGFLASYLVQYQYIRMIAKLNMEVRIDALTMIMNRRGGLEKMNFMLELCKRQKANMAVFMLDIDNFKPYNDSFGHLNGDEALKMVANTISSMFSRSSDVVFRYGGEEFVVCILNEATADAEAKANNLLEAIRSLKIEMPSAVTDSKYMTVSIGYSVFCPNRDSNETDGLNMIDRADKALYVAKKMGKNMAVEG